MPAPDELRKLPLVVACALMVVAVLVELGSAAFLRGAGSGDPPGYGIPYLALVDGILAYSLGLMVLALVLNPNLQAKLQGIVTLILSFLLVLGSLALILVTFVKLMIMVALFFAPPFGTAAYLVVWGHFPKAAAAVILSLILLLKIGMAICLPLAQQRFLKLKSLILLVATSFLATIVVSFLHGFVPGPLVSITDALAGVIVGILARIWAVVILIGSIGAVIQALQTT